MPSCFQCCLMRFPYATILSTLISTCGLIIGFAALFDATSNLERASHDLLQRNYLFLNDLKISYVFAALIVIIVITFNLIVGFLATDQAPDPIIGLQSRDDSFCSSSCIRSSTAICLLQIFLGLNYMIYYILLAVTIVSFIALYTSFVITALCREAPNVNLAVQENSRIPMEYEKFLDLRQFAPLINLLSNETQLMYFKGPRLQLLCSDFVSKFNFHVILCTIGFLLACTGFVRYLINFSVNSAKISTKRKFSELMYLNSEMTPLEAKY